jgi:hypothetical protein
MREGMMIFDMFTIGGLITVALLIAFTVALMNCCRNH